MNYFLCSPQTKAHIYFKACSLKQFTFSIPAPLTQKKCDSWQTGSWYCRKIQEIVPEQEQ